MSKTSSLFKSMADPGTYPGAHELAKTSARSLGLACRPPGPSSSKHNPQDTPIKNVLSVHIFDWCSGRKSTKHRTWHVGDLCVELWLVYVLRAQGPSGLLYIRYSKPLIQVLRSPWTAAKSGRNRLDQAITRSTGFTAPNEGIRS